MFQQKGKYITRCGLVAFVAQVQSIDHNNWLLRGCIRGDDSKILYLHMWKIDGSSLTGDTDFTLVKRTAYARARAVWGMLKLM